MNVRSFIHAVLIAAAAATWACSGTGDETSQPAPSGEGAQGGQPIPEGHPAGAPSVDAAVMRLTYRCAGDAEFEITFSDQMTRASLPIGGATHELTRQEGESGLLLSDGSVVFRGRGMRATVEQDGEVVYADCTATGHSAGDAAAPTAE